MINLFRNIIFFVGLLMATSAALCQSGGTLDEAVSPVWQWRSDNGEALLNFNPANIADSNHVIVLDSIPYAKNYTVVAVYKAIIDTEAIVWELNYGEGSRRGLTTEHIVSDGVSIRYTDATTGVPTVNSLRQSAPDSLSPYVSFTLGGGSLLGRTKVAEILYFDRWLDDVMLRRVQSALAIRYGITLGPVDYVDGKGERIWNHAAGGLFHHRVTGLGRDSTYNICQTYSRSEMDYSMLTLSTDSLPEGGFLMCGDNDAPLLFETVGDIESLNRKWRVNSRGIENLYFTLAFDTRGISGFQDSLVLIVDSAYYLPRIMSPEGVTYGDVVFLRDTSTFTLARGSVFWEMSKSKGRNAQYEESRPVESTIYPNPTSGSYTIEVTGAAWVQVCIYSTQGVLMEHYSDRDRTRYVFDGNLPTGNSYYATVTTESGTQTIKLIVK